MTFSKKIFQLVCLLLLCMAQTGCALLQIPFDLFGSIVGTAVGVGSSAVQLGIAAAPYAAPFFM
jgi:hypothetical protein